MVTHYLLNLYFQNKGNRNNMLIVKEVKGLPPIRVGVKDDDGNYLQGETWKVGHKPISYAEYESIIEKLNLGEDPDTGKKYSTLDAIKQTCWGFSQIDGFDDMVLVGENGEDIPAEILDKQFQERFNKAIIVSIDRVNATWGSVQQRIGNQFDQSKPKRKR